MAAVAIVSCAAVLAALAAPVGPAVADSGGSDDDWALTLPTVVVHRDGAEYRLRLLVSQATMQDESGPTTEQEIDVQVTSRTASHVASASQQAVFAFNIDRTRDGGFTHRIDLSRAGVSANDYISNQLRMNVSFKSGAKQPSTECEGHTQTRSGTLTGTLWFRPRHSHIGSIQKLPSGAHLVHGDGTCPTAVTPEPHITAGPHCTASETFAAGDTLPNNKLHFDVRMDSNSTVAVARAWSYSGSEPYVWRVIHAQLPAKDVSISPDLSSISLHFPSGTYFTGEATARTDGAPMAWPEAGGCPSSGPASTSVYRRGGDYSGDLTVDYFFGSRPSVNSESVAATAASNMYATPG